VVASLGRAHEWSGVPMTPTHRMKMASVASLTSGSPWHMGAQVAKTFNSPLMRAWMPTLSFDAAQPLAEIVQQLNDWQPHLLTGYASMMRILAMMRKARLSNVLRIKLRQDIGVKALRLLHPGSDDFCIKVEAATIADGKTSGYECLITGRGEERVTGLVTAHVTERLYRSSFPAGVFHIEQLFQPLDILEGLSSYGLSFHHQPVNSPHV
jgi:hypothetical protein